MPISDYLRGLRACVGTDLLLVPSVTAIVRDDQNRILLVKTIDRGIWTAPGGGIDPYETPTDAVVREAWEETGLLIAPRRVIGVYGGPRFLVTYANGDQTLYLMTVFDCAVLGGEARPDGLETSELRYVSEEEATHLPLPDWASVVLPDAYRNPSETRFQMAAWRPPS